MSDSFCPKCGQQNQKTMYHSCLLPSGDTGCPWGLQNQFIVPTATIPIPLQSGTDPIIHNRVIYSTERTFSESQVKELLQKQREACVEAWLGSVEVGAQKVANIIRNAVLTI